MIDQKTIKDVLAELELSLATQSNACKIFHKTFASTFEETSESWEDMIKADNLLKEISEIDTLTIKFEDLLEIVRKSLQLLGEIESKSMYN